MSTVRRSRSLYSLVTVIRDFDLMYRGRDEVSNVSWWGNE